MQGKVLSILADHFKIDKTEIQEAHVDYFTRPFAEVKTVSDLPSDPILISMLELYVQEFKARPTSLGFPPLGGSEDARTFALQKDTIIVPKDLSEL